MSESKCINERCNEPAGVLGMCWPCAYWAYDRETS
jgi:hypothetical protein